MNFGDALTQLRLGQCLTRTGWNGPAQYIHLQIPDEFSKMTLPYIYIRTVQNDFVPWLASQTDILAIDWEIDNYGTGSMPPPTTSGDRLFSSGAVA